MPTRRAACVARFGPGHGRRAPLTARARASHGLRIAAALHELLGPDDPRPAKLRALLGDGPGAPSGRHRREARPDGRRLRCVLGLPDQIRALLFDLDGVLTQTSVVHSAAWKEMFDEFLRTHAAQTRTPFVPFDAQADNEEYVDGRSRDDGTRTFLASRGITLPDGGPDDPPGTVTILSLGARKNDLVHQIIERDGVAAYPGSLRYLEAVRAAGLPRAVVSSSANAHLVMKAAKVAEYFDTVIDGEFITEHRLPGKPAPDAFLAGARALGVDAARAVVFEDALAGVAAGRAGSFGFVVGVDRVDQAAALKEHGADIVVEDLAELLDTDGSGARKGGPA